jgi:hypothetical protein
MPSSQASLSETPTLPSQRQSEESFWDSRCLAGLRVCGMRTGITVDVSAADRDWLEAIVADRNSPQKHVRRSRIVLLTSIGVGTNEIMRRTGKTKTVVWRRQERFMQEGVAGLLRDQARTLTRALVIGWALDRHYSLSCLLR